MGKQQTRVVFNLGGQIRISPPIYPGGLTVAIQPGDLTKIAPFGDGVYGYQELFGGNPFKAAPPTQAEGGVLCFENGITRPDFEALMRITGVQPAIYVNPSKDYAVFTAESTKPQKEGYLAQMRLVSKLGLQYMFGAIDDEEYEAFPDQELTMVETLWAFVEHERKRWGTSFYEDGEKGLRGLFGGDGNYAREELSFGFMVENSSNDVYRIWSRAWLVTK